MSLLLEQQRTLRAGSGTILVLTMALGVPLAAQQPVWLNAPDELVPVAQESEWLPPSPQPVATVGRLGWADDDFSAPAALEDAGWLPSVQPPSYRLTLLQGTAAPLTALGTPDTDDVAPYVLYVTPQPRLPLWLGATDERVVQPVQVEDEPYLPLIRQPVYGLRLLVGGDAALTGSITTFADDDAGYRPWILQPSVRLYLLQGGQAPGVYQPVGPPTDEPWYIQTLPAPAPLVLFGPWSYGVAEDTASLLVTEDQWQPRVVQPDYRRILLSGGMAPNAIYVVGPPIDEHAAALPLVAPFPVTLFGPWSYGVAEDTVPLLQGDEGLWLPPLVTPATWAQLVLVQPDELPQFLVLEDAWLPPLVPPSVTARLVLSLPDERPFLATIGVDEDYWLASFLPMRHIVRVAVPMLPPWAYEQREQAFGLVIPPLFEGRAQVIPNVLWQRGPHLWIPGMR